VAFMLATAYLVVYGTLVMKTRGNKKATNP
jgi:hypothetical protein